MKFDSIIFLLDRQMAAIRPEKPLNLFGKDSERQNADGFNWISLEKLPQIPMIPSYCHLEESGEAAEEIYGQLRPYVKGFFKKQSILLCAPDDAPVYVDQKYIREFFIHKGAGTSTTVRTMESLCLARGGEYVAVSRSERLLTMTYRRGQNQPRQAYLPLSLAGPEAVRLAIQNLSPEVAYNQPEIYILDPEGKMEEYHELGHVLGLGELAGFARELAEKNWL